MSSLVEYADENGTVVRGIPVVIVADRSQVSTAAGSKTDYFDTDGHLIRATPLIIIEDMRPAPGPAPSPSPSPSPSPTAADGGTF